MRVNAISSLWPVSPQNQLLALDKENNTIQTTIHTNLVDSFYTSHSNNNLLNEMNEFSTNSAQSLTSPARDNLLIDDGSECTDECTDQCNQNSCNCINNEGGGNDNENYGEEWEKSINQHQFLELLFFSWLKKLFFRWIRWTMPREWLNRTLQHRELWTELGSRQQLLGRLFKRMPKSISR